MSYNNIPLPKMQAKRARTILLADSFRRIAETFPDEIRKVQYIKKAELTRDCGTYLGFLQTNEGVSLVEANFCKGRLCPLCNWRRALRIYSTTSQIMDAMDEKYGKEIKYLFLTLTVENVPAELLEETITTMAAAYKRLMNNRAWKNRVKGAMRSLEITCNHKEKTYHPHYHLILVVDGNYATKGDKFYWTQKDWQEAWAKSARLDYNPIVHISRVRGRKKGIKEVSKYLAKDTDYVLPDNPAEMDRIVYDLQEHTKGRQLISYSGIMSKTRKELGIVNPERQPLTDKIRGDLADAIIRYHWSVGLGCYIPGRPTDQPSGGGGGSSTDQETTNQ